MKTWVKVLAVIIVAAVVIAGAGIYNGVIDIQKLLGHDDGTDGQGDASGELLVHFIDVGQGDSILIQMPNGLNILIDAGGTCGPEALISYLHKCSVDSIDFFFITHPHANHINYADEVLGEFDVENILMTNYEMDTATYEDLISAVEVKQNAGELTRIQLSIGQQFISGDGCSILKVLFFDDNADDPNDASIVLRLDFGNTSFLFTGNIGFDVEDQLIEQWGSELDVDILKVAYYGSAYSTSGEFLTATSPLVSVISVGPNEYGHPSDATLDRLNAWGSAVYTTWDDGDLVVTTDGTEYSISTS